MYKKTDWRYFSINFMMIFIPLSVLISALLFYIYHSETTADLEIITALERNKLSFKFEVISKEYTSITDDLKMISNSHEMEKILNGIPFDVNDLSADLLALSIIKKKYDQIRYLDETGLEVIRINFNNGKPVVVPSEKLQNKARRYYFEDTFALTKNEIFVSPLDLNIEHGKIETPLKPMIRIGTPVYSNTGEKKGILLLNYFGAILIDKLQDVSGNNIGQLSLLNPAGYWLKGQSSDDEWGFMYENKKDRTFGEKYPRAWERIFSSDSGQFENNNGLFTYTTLYPLLKYHTSSTGADKAFMPSRGQVDGKKYHFKIVSHIPYSLLKKTVDKISLSLLWIYISFILILIAGSWGYAHFKDSRRRAEKNREILIKDLQQALAEVKTLRGILPICSYCKKIRNDQGDYEQIEGYIHKKSGVNFSHTICPSCMSEHYPNIK